MMKRMSFSETIFLFFLALIIFGPKKLPEIARQVGKALNEFRRASNEFKAQIEQEIAHLETENRKQTALPASPSPEGTASRTLNATLSEVSSAPTTSIETGPAESPTTISEDEPLFATGAAALTPEPPSGVTEVLPASDAVTAPSSQESHV
jgi:sec-independent protein translocase protein TatB